MKDFSWIVELAAPQTYSAISMKHSFLSFNPRLQKMLETGWCENQLGEQIPVNSTSTLNNLHVLRQLVIRRRLAASLEIGMAYAASALTILATMKEIHGTGDFHHTAIDPFQRGHWQGAGVHAIQSEDLGGRFSLIEEMSFSALPGLVKDGRRFDLIYVDGSHIFEDVFIDFYVSTFLLQKHGCILFDDCRDRHVAKVIRFIRSNFASILRPMDLSPYEGEKPLVKHLGNLMGVSQLKGFEKIEEPPRQWNASFARF